MDELHCETKDETKQGAIVKKEKRKSKRKCGQLDLKPTSTTTNKTNDTVCCYYTMVTIDY